MEFVYIESGHTYGSDFGAIDFVTSVGREFHPYLTIKHIRGNDVDAHFELIDNKKIMQTYDDVLNYTAYDYQEITDKIWEYIKNKHNIKLHNVGDDARNHVLNLEDTYHGENIDIQSMDSVLPTYQKVDYNETRYHPIKHQVYNLTDNNNLDDKTRNKLKRQICANHSPPGSAVHNQCLNDKVVEGFATSQSKKKSGSGKIIGIAFIVLIVCLLIILFLADPAGFAEFMLIWCICFNGQM
jgi:hypothetical protein